ncbi:phosphotransferase [Actinomyces wuliandei]|uniref:phosphotransferase n=1 Tax=Actinomyces wuliandei TaxID=2057743 RepID=UPI000FD97915|nr:phosphotransferase [Actinomyces wuliandei]
MRPRAWPQDKALLEALGAWLPARRWFPLKGAGGSGPQALRLVGCQDMAPTVRDLLVAVPRGVRPVAAEGRAAGQDGADTDGADAARRGQRGEVVLHVPVVLEEPGALDSFAVADEPPGSHGLVLEGPAGTVALVDGTHHPDFWRAWARQALEAGTVLEEDGAKAILQRAHRLRVSTSQQSNSSVVLPAPAPGQQPGGPEDACVPDLVVKLIRVLDEGRNPDVEVSVALARDGWDRVRRPVAWSVATWTPARPEPGPDTASTPPTASAAPTASSASTDSAVACVFVPEAEDGFELFCALASSDDADGPVRERALSLASSLGDTTAQMHDHLVSALGASAPPPPRELADALRLRAGWALAEVPEVSRRIPGAADQVRDFLTHLEALDALAPSSRVHGDYHLGQVLHETGGQQRWYVLDFEGEPLRPLAERTRPDQPLRDVAGMLRSFDYAAAVGGAAHPGWLPAVRRAFTDGYHSRARCGHGPAALDQAASEVLLACLELDKALYEAVYEARNRPDWLSIPLDAIASLLETRAAPGAPGAAAR